MEKGAKKKLEEKITDTMTIVLSVDQTAVHSHCSIRVMLVFRINIAILLMRDYMQQ